MSSIINSDALAATPATRQTSKLTPTRQRIREIAIAAIIVFAILAIQAWISPAIAGGDTTFDNLTTMVKDWLEGSGGKFLAVLGFGIALASGLIKGSVAGIVFGLGLALSAVYGPNILVGMFTATF